MKRYGKWLTISGAVLALIAIVGGHFLQYVIGNDLASVIAVIVGATGGSCFVQGLVMWKFTRRPSGPGPVVIKNNVYRSAP